MRLWSGRTNKEIDPDLDRLNASLAFDIRMVGEDIDGSQAWAGALAGAGVLSDEEANTLVEGLERVRTRFERGEFEPEPTDEDIHTAVERLLTEEVGALAGALHTGRSRNDQVATDFRLWTMRACRKLQEMLDGYATAVLDCALKALEDPMPGYTHLQHAQPVTWGHWVLAHFWALMRDRARFASVEASALILPLGSGALAGSAFAVDREALANQLGFEAVSPNSIDVVSDRDFALEFLFAASVLGLHLSRFAEMLIIFNSTEFGFITIDDAFVTGSSLMPQKRNPDALELARGKSGRLIGHLTGLLATLKGLPSAYDKDLQEDKEPVFDAYDTMELLLPALTGLVATMQVHTARMAAKINIESMATDLVDYIVRKGVRFREAHAIVGRAVRTAEEAEIPLSDLPLEQLQALSSAFDVDVTDVFNPKASLERRAVTGGTSSAALQAQVEAAREVLGGNVVAG
jgi:argininosuccinate lyase